MRVEPLPPERLRWSVPEGALPFRDTREVEPSARIVGQELALRAIRQAVEMNRPGYNLFVAGLESGGRLRTVQRILEDLAPRRRRHRDFVYVRNFRDVTRPRLLVFPAGSGGRFARELAGLGEFLHEEVPRILDSEPVRKRRDRCLRELERSQRERLMELGERVCEEGFVVAEDEEGRHVVLYVVDGEPRSRAEAHLLASKGGTALGPDELERRFDELEDALAAALGRTRARALTVLREVEEVERAAVREGIAPAFEDLARRFPAARQWLGELHEAVAQHLDLFRGGEDDVEDDGLLLAFQARVLHRGSRSRKAPIVLVPDPTFGNLFGGIAHDGAAGRAADHTHLRAGALHDADGGFLVVNAADLLSEPGSWKTLKRAMLFGQLGLQNLETATQGAAAPLRPDPVPLDVKVVLLGERALYAYLHEADPDFPSIFKVLAEFEPTSDYTDDLARDVAAFLARIARREGLRPLSAGAVAAIVEDAVRRSGRGGRIRLAFGDIADLAREADYLADGEVVDRADVERALEERRRRLGRIERLVRDALRRDLIHVETTGRVAGQVNGLAVVTAGGHRFGRPLRVTASVGAGRGGVVNIERESGLSGRLHDKGVAVLTGFLRGRFGRRRTLALTASICVEQNYARIDGDSASSAELYALLSAIAGVPLRQGRAVTGSVDQHGRVQAVGGVNEKVEGFFRLCAERGLDGEQGVLVPAANVPDLQLPDDVVEACAAGRFHVWPVRTVEEGFALLSDLEVGDPAAEAWPAGTFYGRVDAALGRLERVARRAQRGGSGRRRARADDEGGGPDEEEQSTAST